MAGVYREVWTGEVDKGFQAGLKDTFLDGVKDMSRFVEQGRESAVIHSTLFGVSPEVLINNSTYPIAVQALDGKDVPIALDKYQTRPTPVTDDELHALSYDKIKETKDAHARALVRARLQKSAHSFTPAGHTDKTPVLLTTGEAVNGRKRLRWEDVVTLRESLLNAGVELENYRLVLCQEHVNDLLLIDQTFARSYADFKNGIITNQLGFEIRAYDHNPYFNPTAKTKASFGALPNTGLRRASFCFPVEHVAKAQGATQMYYSSAETDPQNQRSLVAFRNYFIAMPQLTDGFGAIVSANA